MSNELHPCPFCNCTDIGEVTVNLALEARHRRFKVYCKGCQVRTSDQRTKKAARQQWNTRTQAQPADALVEGLETIALESTDEQARCCAHHYLATYRAAQAKK